MDNRDDSKVVGSRQYPYNCPSGGLRHLTPLSLGWGPITSLSFASVF
jgi:hypothetical protein